MVRHAILAEVIREVHDVSRQPKGAKGARRAGIRPPDDRDALHRGVGDAPPRRGRDVLPQVSEDPGHGTADDLKSISDHYDDGQMEPVMGRMHAELLNGKRSNARLESARAIFE
jgi:hypothetical protein